MYRLSESLMMLGGEEGVSLPLALLRRATDSLVRRRGIEHPDTVRAMMDLAGATRGAGRKEEGNALMDRALEVSRRISPEGESTMTGSIQRALWFFEDGGFAEAEARLIEVMETSLRTRGANNNYTIWSREVYGRVCHARGRLSEAERWLAGALEARRRVQDDEHFEVLLVRHLLAEIYQAQGRAPEAERMYVECLRGARIGLGEGHWFTLRAMDRVATAQWAGGRKAQGESLWRELLEAQWRSLPANRRKAAGDGDRPRRASHDEGGPGDAAWDDARDRLIARAARTARNIARLCPEAEGACRLQIARLMEYVASNPSGPGNLNGLAWARLTWPVPGVLDPDKSVELARQAVEKAPEDGAIWNSLGVALYRAGDWKAAIEALGKADELSPDKSPAFNGFFLAMTHRQLGDRERARSWYDRAVEWMDRHGPEDEALRRLRAEAAALLGLADLPNDVFVRP
jgi:tetratricopeptide (TPR) repeat protein